MTWNSWVVDENLDDIDWFLDVKSEEDRQELERRMFEVDSEALGTQTPKVVLLFISFCTRYKDESEAIR
jgi:hypothetical protein